MIKIMLGCSRGGGGSLGSEDPTHTKKGHVQKKGVRKGPLKVQKGPLECTKIFHSSAGYGKNYDQVH